MVELQRQRVEDRIKNMMEELDRTILRRMQADMHKCAATCYENDTQSMARVQQCAENCSTTPLKAQQYIQGELERVQNRLQRCVMECNDTIKDKLGPNPSQSEVDRYGEVFDNCATKCVDNFCDMLPPMEKTMKRVLTTRKFE